MWDACTKNLRTVVKLLRLTSIPTVWRRARRGTAWVVVAVRGRCAGHRSHLTSPSTSASGQVSQCAQTVDAARGRGAYIARLSRLRLIMNTEQQSRVCPHGEKLDKIVYMYIPRTPHSFDSTVYGGEAVIACTK
jgi:hypothetical protein